MANPTFIIKNRIINASQDITASLTFSLIPISKTQSRSNFSFSETYQQIFTELSPSTITEVMVDLKSSQIKIIQGNNSELLNLQPNFRLGSASILTPTGSILIDLLINKTITINEDPIQPTVPVSVNSSSQQRQQPRPLPRYLRRFLKRSQILPQTITTTTTNCNNVETIVLGAIGFAFTLVSIVTLGIGVRKILLFNSLPGNNTRPVNLENLVPNENDVVQYIDVYTPFQKTYTITTIRRTSNKIPYAGNQIVVEDIKIQGPIVYFQASAVSFVGALAFLIPAYIEANKCNDFS